MKRSILFSATALAAFVMTGCNPSGGGSATYSYPVPVKTVETSPDKTVVTNRSYDEKTATQTAEIQTVNGKTSYVKDNFEFTTDSEGRDMVICIRSTMTEGGEVREKLVYTYGFYYNNRALETKYEEFLLGEGGSDTEPVRYSITDWYNDGNQKEVKKYEGETMVLHWYDFQYDPNKGGYTYKEQQNGGEPVTMCYKVTERDPNNAIIGDELYSEWDGEKGILIKKTTDYESENLTIEYKITEYDSEGNNPVETRVEEDYKIIEVTYNY